MLTLQQKHLISKNGNLATTFLGGIIQAAVIILFS